MFVSLRVSTFFTAVLLLAVPASALAQDEEIEEPDFDEEEGEEGEEEEFDDEVDDEEIYNEYREGLRGEGPTEEIDAWLNYLEVYSKSLYRLEIERRIEALEEASYQETLEERLAEEESTKVDAKDEELLFYSPTLLSLSPNTRRHVEVGVLWGFADRLNYELNVEWNFHRQFSVFGGLRHVGRDLGAGVVVGAKGAFLKDTRLGLLMSGMFNIEAGGSPKTGPFFVIQPTYGFGFRPNDFFQIQTTLGLRLRVDNLHHQVLWNIQAAISPNEFVAIYFESLQKHSFYSPETGDDQYFGFHQAGVGVKIRPIAPIELSVGANIPYALRLWRDYRYVGIHVNFTVYLPGLPKAGRADAPASRGGGEGDELDALPMQFAPRL